MKTLALLALSTLMSTTVLAQNIAITGGKVITMGENGTLHKATILIEDGTIQQVSGDDIEIPEGYQVIDASGKTVTPGLIGAFTSLGLVEVSSSAGVVDATVDPTPITKTGAALDVSYAVNPDSSLMGVTRIEGMTAAATGITYTDFLFSGQGAVISLSGDEPVLKSQAFVTVDVTGSGSEHTGGSRAALWVTIEQALAEADAVTTLPGPDTAWHGLNTPNDISALKKVLSGDLPLFMKADRASDIRQVIAFKERHSMINVVLIHAVEAWRVADALAEADIPVIIDPEYNLPGNFDQLGATLANAARLEQAGVSVAIGMDTHNIRLATQHAGNAVASGLSYDAGIASLTRTPAQILGMEDTLGQIGTGYRADVVIWSGDPLEVTEVAEQVIINGSLIDMESRQSRLRERYVGMDAASDTSASHYVRP
ncbi:amidohydrolase family protein [Alteromonas halophila]|uniref:Amidohydrolase n=1 Tax=Alteromonas halophila TaxID=516698 RepID=A0A918MVZ6_9ALTE|nr:amidohydrolase family protein [Alteromonas halophila]GGW75241.1 amidohydrolase [Alteromonas halophila]